LFFHGIHTDLDQRMEKRVTFKGWLLPLLLVFPQLLISVVFFFYPAGQAVWQSLFIPDPFGLSSQFVGLGNFEFLLSDRFYRASFVTTAIFSTLVTLVSMVPALFLAVLADRLVKSAGVYRTLLIWPYAVAPAVAGVLWLFMFNTRVGVVAWYLGQLGYDWNHVLNPHEAMGLVVVASSWGRISYNFLFFFAALQSVPRSVIEAAAIDGARFWRRFFTIVLPLISPTTFFLLVVNVVYAFFETFGVIHTITSGGPQQATTILVYKVFSDGFVGQDLGSSAAQSVILLIVVGLLTILQFRFVERRVHY
jgi:sn-glycerol 3-phosphate transport system permease protein